MDFSGVGKILPEIVTIFIIALIVVRLMGNRTVGQFSPFDFVIMVGIGDIVGNVALDPQSGLLAGAEALIGLLILQKVLAWAALKNNTLRRLVEGEPVIIIENGKIITANLVKTQFNMDDLRQELHKKGLDFTNLAQIKSARLESCGEFSVIMAEGFNPLTKKDVLSLAAPGNPLNPLGDIFNKLKEISAGLEFIKDDVKTRRPTNLK